MLIPKRSNRIFPIECASCGKSFVVEAKYKGKKLPCPKCSTEMVVNEKSSSLSEQVNQVTSSRVIYEEKNTDSNSIFEPPVLKNEQNEIRAIPTNLGVLYKAIAVALVMTFAVGAKVAVEKLFVKKPTKIGNQVKPDLQKKTNESETNVFDQKTSNNKEENEGSYGEAIIKDPGLDPRDRGTLNFVKIYTEKKNVKESEESYQKNLNDAQEKLQDLLKRNVKEALLLNLQICLFKKDAVATTIAGDKLLSQSKNINDIDKILNILYESALENDKDTGFSNKIIDYLCEKDFYKAVEYKALTKNDTVSLKALADQGNQIAQQQLLKKYFSDRNIKGLEEFSQKGSEVAKKFLIQVYITNKDKDNLKKEADKGNIEAKRAWELIICESGSIDEIKKLAESGNEEAKEKYEEKVIKTGSIEEIILLAHAGYKKAQREVEEKIKYASSQNNLDLLQKIESMGVDAALEPIINEIFNQKKWKLLSKYFQKYCALKNRKGEQNMIFDICAQILEESEIENKETDMAWAELVNLSNNEFSKAQYYYAFFLYREDYIKKYRLQEIVKTDYQKAEEIINKIIKYDPSAGYYLLGDLYYRQNNYSSAYEYLEKAANCGNFRALKDQIVLLRQGQGQAHSESAELYCRYLSQCLDDGSDQKWTDTNKRYIKEFEKKFTDAISESLKIKANLKASEIQKWKNKNRGKTEQIKEDQVVSGTGFFINEEGFIITAAHVLQDCNSISVIFKKNKVQAKVILLDQENDIAVLKINIDEKVPFLVFSQKPPEQGDKISTFGFPVVLSAEENDVKFKSGDISSLRGIGGDPRKIRLNLDVDPGNSGGPLLDSKSKVIGIILSKRNWKTMLEETGELSGGISYAIKNEYIFPILEKHQLGRKISFGDSSFKTADSIVEVQAH